MIGRFSALVLATALVAFAAFGLPDRHDAEAAPPGAAVGMNANGMGCAFDGTVFGNFTWAPSGLGVQYVDLSRFNDAFAGGYASIGPLSGQVGYADFGSLSPLTTYYARVNTAAPQGWLPSDTLVFTTPSCGGGGAVFTPPTGLNAFALSPTALRFHWQPGADNQWYCLDVAHNLNDLLSFSGSWSNHHCFTTATVVDVGNLDCGRQYYWRVFAWGASNSGHSTQTTVNTLGCQTGFTPPGNLSSNVISGDLVTFNWSYGEGNQAFCVDVAENTADLVSISGTFRNYGCGTSGTSIQGFGLRCDTTYVWRVFGYSNIASGYSGTASVHTADCAFSAPVNLDVEVESATSAFFSWDPGANNESYCVDLAQTRNDLIFFGETWRNYGCGTEDDDLFVSGLVCDTDYWWRVYAVSEDGDASGHSGIDQFETDNCSQGGGN